MSERGDRVEPLEDAEPATERRRPSLLVAGSLVAAAIVAFLVVSEPPVPPPPATVPEGPPALPTLPGATTSTTASSTTAFPSTTTMTPPTSLPLDGFAFSEDTALTWTPTSGLTDLTAVLAVAETPRGWWLLGHDGETSRLYSSTDGLSWDEEPVPMGEGGARPRLTEAVALGDAVAVVGVVDVPGTGEVPTVWWTRHGAGHGAQWTARRLPTEPVPGAPADARATVFVTGAARAGEVLVVAGERVLSTLSSFERPGSSPAADVVPDSWGDLVDADLASVGLWDRGLLLSVEPFYLDQRSFEELGVVRYRSTLTHHWVGEPFGSFELVDPGSEQVVPVGTGDGGRALGYAGGSAGRLVVSDDGRRWSPVGSVTGYRYTAPWGGGWIGYLDDQVRFTPDGSSDRPLSPEGFLGARWHLVHLATSELGIFSLAVSVDGGSEPSDVLTVAGSDGAEVVYEADGSSEVSIRPKEGPPVWLGQPYGLLPQAVTLDGESLVFSDPRSGEALTRLPVARWVEAWEAYWDQRRPEGALVHSPDGRRWSARRADTLAGPLAGRVASVHAQDDVALIVVTGTDVPRVWAGFPRPGRG